MKLEHLSNKSATNLHSELSSTLMKAGEFSIATAFINQEAIELIATSLKKNKKLQGRILIGLYNFFNKKKDLEALLQLVNNNPARLQVHISLDQCFHWKYYHFVGQKQTFYIGSANFTTSGMADNRELVIKLTDNLKTADRSLQSLANSFEKEWLHSRPLAEFPLKHYKETELPKSLAGGIHHQIKDFFDQKAVHSFRLKLASDKLYAITVEQKVKAATRKEIQGKKSGWFAEGWEFLVLRTLVEYQQCINLSHLLFFDKRGHSTVTAELIERMDEAEGIETPDGKYFIAYKVVKQKHLSRDDFDQLKSPRFKIDLLARNNKFSGKMLGKKQAVEIRKILGI